jgi:FtsH-binding integral membrane protein
MNVGALSALFLGLHAVTAGVALFTGAFVRRRPKWFATYYWSWVLMVAFLVAGIVADVGARPPGVLVIDAVLVALATFMVWRAKQARRLADHRSRRSAQHIGFTLVGLIDAFVVVTLFNLEMPGWLVAVIGAGIAGLGHVVIGVAHPHDRRHPPGLCDRTPTSAREPAQGPRS